MDDLISRRDILRCLTDISYNICKTKEEVSVINIAKSMVSVRPSAKPEPLTDKEQRIFLAAMEREEKVCEEVDRKYIREPYEDSLMRICKEIRRKVKGALWT